MKITEVKIQDLGYLVNSSIFVPKDEKNRHYIEVKKWIEDGGEVKPPFTKEEIENLKLSEEKQKRDHILKKGAKTADGKMWFNLDSAQMFISGFSTLDKDELYPWYNAKREKVELTYEEAKVYAKEIRTVLQKLYGLS